MKLSLLLIFTLLVCGSIVVRGVVFEGTCSIAGTDTSLNCDAHLYCDGATATCLKCPTYTQRTSTQSSPANETESVCTACTNNFFNEPGTACGTTCQESSADVDTLCMGDFECNSDACEACAADTFRAQDSTSGCVAGTNDATATQACSSESGPVFCSDNLYCSEDSVCVACPSGSERLTTDRQSAPGIETEADCIVSCENYEHTAGEDCPTACGTTTLNHTACQEDFECNNNLCQACGDDEYRVQDSTDGCVAYRTVGQTCSNATGTSYCGPHLFCSATGVCTICASGTSRDTPQSAVEATTSSAACTNTCANYEHTGGEDCPALCGATGSTQTHTLCKGDFYCNNNACSQCSGTTLRTQSTNAACSEPSNTKTADQSCSSDSTGGEFCAAHLYCASTSLCVACPTGKARPTNIQDTSEVETETACDVTCSGNFYNAPGSACVATCTTDAHCLANFECETTNSTCIACSDSATREQTSLDGCTVASSSIIHVSFLLLSIIFSLII